jgi:hypothetical protein
MSHVDGIPHHLGEESGDKRPDELHEYFQVTCHNVQAKKISKFVVYYLFH